MLRLLWIQFFTGGFRAVRGQFQFSVRFKWRIPLTVSERFELDFRFVFYWSFQCRSQRQFWMNVNFHWFWEQTRSDYDRTALSTVLSEQFGSSSRMNLIEFHFPPVLGTVSIERRFPLTWRMEWIELKVSTVHLRWMRPGKLSLPSSIWKSIFKNLIFVEIFRCSTGRRRKEGRKEENETLITDELSDCGCADGWDVKDIHGFISGLSSGILSRFSRQEKGRRAESTFDLWPEEPPGGVGGVAAAVAIKLRSKLIEPQRLFLGFFFFFFLFLFVCCCCWVIIIFLHSPSILTFILQLFHQQWAIS